MELTEHRPGDHHVVRSVDERGIRIDDSIHRQSLIVGAHFLDTDWPVTALDELDDARLRPLLELEPEIVIIGVGGQQQILPPSLQRSFQERAIGVECMTLRAACRTFNVLMSENRRALAALIWGA